MSDEASRGAAERHEPEDAAAFAALYRAHGGDVARLCRRMLGPDAAAEDAASEVFLRARRAFGSYERQRPFRPWVLRIAGHYCIDQLRRRRIETRLFEAADLDAGALPDPGPSPLRRLVWAEEREAVAKAIEALPLRYRLPLVLRYFSELDYDAIAELLELNRGQVATLLFRAKRQLRERLAARSAAGTGR